MKIRIEMIETNGTHAFAADVRTLSDWTVEIPDAEAAEVRPDWGQYSPVVTFPAIERALRRRGLLPFPGRLQRVRFGIVPPV